MKHTIKQLEALYKWKTAATRLKHLRKIKINIELPKCENCVTYAICGVKGHTDFKSPEEREEILRCPQLAICFALEYIERMQFVDEIPKSRLWDAIDSWIEGVIIPNKTHYYEIESLLNAF